MHPYTHPKSPFQFNTVSEYLATTTYREVSTESPCISLTKLWSSTSNSSQPLGATPPTLIYLVHDQSLANF